MCYEGATVVVKSRKQADKELQEGRTMLTGMRTGIPITLLGAAAALSGLLMIGGCKQMEGERCQIDDDCASGLYCELSGNTRAVGGYCKSTTSTNPVIMDLSSKPKDLTATMDLSPVDMAGTD
jgi:hypothetical protein